MGTNANEETAEAGDDVLQEIERGHRAGRHQHHRGAHDDREGAASTRRSAATSTARFTAFERGDEALPPQFERVAAHPFSAATRRSRGDTMPFLVIIRPGQKPKMSSVFGALRLEDLHRTIGVQEALGASGLGIDPRAGRKLAHIGSDDFGLTRARRPSRTGGHYRTGREVSGAHRASTPSSGRTTSASTRRRPPGSSRTSRRAGRSSPRARRSPSRPSQSSSCGGGGRDRGRPPPGRALGRLPRTREAGGSGAQRPSDGARAGGVVGLGPGPRPRDGPDRSALGRRDVDGGLVDVGA